MHYFISCLGNGVFYHSNNKVTKTLPYIDYMYNNGFDCDSFLYAYNIFNTYFLLGMGECLNVKIRGQFARAGSFLPPCRSGGLNSDCQV